MKITNENWFNDIWRGQVGELYFAIKSPPKNKEEYLERLLIEYRTKRSV